MFRSFNNLEANKLIQWTLAPRATDHVDPCRAIARFPPHFSVPNVSVNLFASIRLSRSSSLSADGRSPFAPFAPFCNPSFAIFASFCNPAFATFAPFCYPSSLGCLRTLLLLLLLPDSRAFACRGVAR